MAAEHVYPEYAGGDQQVRAESSRRAVDEQGADEGAKVQPAGGEKVDEKHVGHHCADDCQYQIKSSHHSAPLTGYVGSTYPEDVIASITSKVIVSPRFQGRLGESLVTADRELSETALPGSTGSGLVDFGSVLRDWRRHRRMSQLDLATHSGISQRHISFLETGRSNPSRGMVLALSDSLDIPLRERNTLLQSAGFSAAYAEQPLDDAHVRVFREALQATLHHHDPYPAMVLDGRWNLVMANESALRFFSLFVDPFAALERMGSPTEFQMARLCLSDLGLKPYIVNWQDLAYSFLQRARRALLVNPTDALLPALIDEIMAHPEAPPTWQKPDWSSPTAPALTMTLAHGGDRYTFFTMLAHFGAAQNVTIEELSVESFYPADAPTRDRLIELAS